MASRPEISTRRDCRSVVSALPRIEPIAFWKKDSVGLSDIFRSRARNLDRFVFSMSCVASNPAAFRATSASVIGLKRAKKLCHGDDTEAKPERRDMTEMPMTPILDSEASSMF